MTALELLNKIERDDFDKVFTDLHIMNDVVVGFYKTQIMKIDLFSSMIGINFDRLGSKK